MARPAREPRDRPRGAMAAGLEARLHDDRLGGARVERPRRARAPPDRPGAAPLPLGRLYSRAGQAAHDGVRDVLLGMVAAADEPIAGGRHKVFGHHELAVIPQTSTIASHPPRAVGIAFATRARARARRRLRVGPRTRSSCARSGDASLNHATSQAALNAAGVPPTAASGSLLFLCRTTASGSACRRRRAGSSSRPRPPRARLRARGRRRSRGPAPDCARDSRTGCASTVIQQSSICTVRYRAAGADLETAYRSGPEIRADYERDPLLATARWLASGGGRTGEELGRRRPRVPHPDSGARA